MCDNTHHATHETYTQVMLHMSSNIMMCCIIIIIIMLYMFMAHVHVHVHVYVHVHVRVRYYATCIIRLRHLCLCLCLCHAYVYAMPRLSLCSAYGNSFSDLSITLSGLRMR